MLGMANNEKKFETCNKDVSIILKQYRVSQSNKQEAAKLETKFCVCKYRGERIVKYLIRNSAFNTIAD